MAQHSGSEIYSLRPCVCVRVATQCGRHSVHLGNVSIERTGGDDHGYIATATSTTRNGHTLQPPRIRLCMYEWDASGPACTQLRTPRRVAIAQCMNESFIIDVIKFYSYFIMMQFIIIKFHCASASATVLRARD